MNAMRFSLAWPLLLLLLSAACGPGTTGTTPGPQPAEEVTDSTPVHSVGQLVGKEAFISIGGMQGISHDAVLNELQAAYVRNGFRVHWVVAPPSFTPMAERMTQVAAEYRAAGSTATDIVFHHTGHGWLDHFSYQQPDGTRGQDTPHATLFNHLSTTFPRDQNFRLTWFMVVLDACGQGSFVSQMVAGRHGYNISSSPRAASADQCRRNACTYVCDACGTQLVPGYQFSRTFATNLNNWDANSLEAARLAFVAANRNLRDNWSCSRDGVTRQY